MKKENKEESSNSQVLKRPLSEEDWSWRGGAFYTPLVAETRSLFF